LEHRLVLLQRRPERDRLAGREARVERGGEVVDGQALEGDTDPCRVVVARAQQRGRIRPDRRGRGHEGDQRAGEDEAQARGARVHPSLSPPIPTARARTGRARVRQRPIAWNTMASAARCRSPVAGGAVAAIASSTATAPASAATLAPAFAGRQGASTTKAQAPATSAAKGSRPLATRLGMRCPSSSSGSASCQSGLSNSRGKNGKLAA